MDRWREVARSGVARGATHDEIASDLIAGGAGPINAMKTMRIVLGLHLAESKPIVFDKLSPEAQASAQRLLHEAEASLAIE